MVKIKNKRAQQVLGLSFSMIFSIILIIFFIVVAFIAINAFLGTKRCAQIGIFVEEFEKDVKKAWNSQKFDDEFQGILPSSIEYVCFANLSRSFRGENKKLGENFDVYEGLGGNLFLYPKEKACEMPYHKIKHLDMESIIEKENPYCIPVEGGKINIQVEKGFNDRLVKVG